MWPVQKCSSPQVSFLFSSSPSKIVKSVSVIRKIVSDDRYVAVFDRLLIKMSLSQRELWFNNMIPRERSLMWVSFRVFWGCYEEKNQVKIQLILCDEHHPCCYIFQKSFHDWFINQCLIGKSFFRAAGYFFCQMLSLLSFFSQLDHMWYLFANSFVISLILTLNSSCWCFLFKPLICLMPMAIVWHCQKYKNKRERHWRLSVSDSSLYF